MNKLQYEFLLIKTGQVTYKTPCGSYLIEYTNIWYLDDINWVAKQRNGNVIIIYGNTVQDVLLKLVEKYPYMDTKLYKILHDCLDK